MKRRFFAFCLLLLLLLPQCGLTAQAVPLDDNPQVAAQQRRAQVSLFNGFSKSLAHRARSRRLTFGQRATRAETASIFTPSLPRA